MEMFLKKTVRPTCTFTGLRMFDKTTDSLRTEALVACQLSIFLSRSKDRSVAGYSWELKRGWIVLPIGPMNDYTPCIGFQIYY